MTSRMVHAAQSHPVRTGTSPSFRGPSFFHVAVRIVCSSEWLMSLLLSWFLGNTERERETGLLWKPNVERNADDAAQLSLGIIRMT